MEELRSNLEEAVKLWLEAGEPEKTQIEGDEIVELAISNRSSANNSQESSKKRVGFLPALAEANCSKASIRRSASVAQASSISAEAGLIRSSIGFQRRFFAHRRHEFVTALIATDHKNKVLALSSGRRVRFDAPRNYHPTGCQFELNYLPFVPPVITWITEFRADPNTGHILSDLAPAPSTVAEPIFIQLRLGSFRHLFRKDGYRFQAQQVSLLSSSSRLAKSSISPGSRDFSVSCRRTRTLCNRFRAQPLHEGSRSRAKASAE